MTPPRPKYASHGNCQICRHKERKRIELMHTAGVSLDKIAAKFHVKRDSIWRHAEKHVTPEEKAAYLLGPARLSDLIEAVSDESASILDYYGILRSVLFGQLTRLARENDAAGVASISSRIARVLQDISRITGELSTLTNSTVINVNNATTIINSAPFADLQSGLLRVCAAHPEARADVVALFTDLDRKYSQRAPETIEALPVVREAMEEASHAA